MAISFETLWWKLVVSQGNQLDIGNLLRLAMLMKQTQVGLTPSQHPNQEGK